MLREGGAARTRLWEDEDTRGRGCERMWLQDDEAISFRSILGDHDERKLARIFLPKLSLSTTTSVLCTLRPLIPFLFNILHSCHMPDIITSSFCTTRLNLLRMWRRMMSFDHPLLSADVSLSFSSDEGGGKKRATAAAKMPRSQHDVRWSE